jgi:hypothetical protein
VLLSAALHECAKLVFHIRGEHRLRILQKKKPRKILEPQGTVVGNRMMGKTA